MIYGNIILIGRLRDKVVSLESVPHQAWIQEIAVFHLVMLAWIRRNLGHEQKG